MIILFNRSQCKIPCICYGVRLHDGDHLPSVLESLAEEVNLTGALCFFLGGVKDEGRVVVGPEADSVPPNPTVTLLNGIHEVCAIGTIFVDEKGKPKVHMHAAFGRNGKTVTGCIRMGIDVWEVGEVVVLEISGPTGHRTKDERTGFEVQRFSARSSSFVLI